ncbi:Rho-binding antiterminator [Pseudomonas sp. UL073]|uniref:Rho-binding antiterminator n=1 Tax=Zestomonas insulae TaxID=2809017 RepID=A0ABS2ICA2_9GAMM|nr:Rho-binding antiterminator [Pseudomonas insulae]MBM7060756.1 Rho-binding antiterminator [Pseudomonas insulae]
MQPYQPLACELYDHLEVACLYGYRLKVELTDGSTLEAQALTTRTNAAKEEFLCLRGADGPLEIRLDHLLAITPLDAGSRFGRVELGGTRCPS